MAVFLDYIEREKILNQLLDFYKYSIKKNEKEKIINLLNKILFKLNQSRVQSADINLFGSLYEKYVSAKNRKLSGEFYTPKRIVNFILDEVRLERNKNVIDISCGTGNFLVLIINKLKEQYQSDYDKNYLDATDYKKIIDNLGKYVYGVDINPIACILCQLNIQYTLFDYYQRIKQVDSKYQFPFFKIFNENSLELKNKEIFSFGKIKFDLVIGNPPYIFLRDVPSDQRDLIDHLDFKTKGGQYDYYQLFIELGLDLLKEHGYLGYILPDSILALSNRDSIRKYIYNNSKIISISHGGSEFEEAVVSNIVLILEKEKSRDLRENNKVKVASSISKPICHYFTQKKIESWDYKFLIHLNNKDSRILDYLKKEFPKLKDISAEYGIQVLLSRGVELTKTGSIIFCEICQKYFPVPKKLICKSCKNQLTTENIEEIVKTDLSDKKNDNFKPFIYAINRYKTTEIRYIDMTKRGINYKNLDLYEDRIVIRQLSQDGMICATYVKEFCLTSQSFYNLKIKNNFLKNFNHYYLLGLINSKLLSYYFIKLFGSYKKLFPRILIEKIKRLPIKIPSSEEEQLIAENIALYVKELLNSEEKHTEIQEIVDTMVFDLYYISFKDREDITSFLVDTQKI
ncbi:MAG: Eco57I restriction-modification methylase domain-containing protein [Promethearchaeota archaeon]